jgi:tetratricopeptide (TPR) repeat protein
MAHYQLEDEDTRLRRKLSEKAVDLAIKHRWEEAEIVNRTIVERFPSDVEAYNRLGKALTELGAFVQAKEAYIKALSIAPSNSIANRNLGRLANLPELADEENRKALPSRVQVQKVAPEFFAAETGKSGVLNLCNMGSPDLLARMALGDEVQLSMKGAHLIVESAYGEYLGEIEAKHALRLIRLMKGGNEYGAAIISLRLPDEVQVIIKETYQDPSQVGHLSFPVQIADDVRSYGRESFIRRKLASDRAETKVDSDNSDEEAEYPNSEEEALPEGFTVLDDVGHEGEIEV